MQVGKALKNKSLLKVPLNLQTKSIYNSFITVGQNHFCIVNDYLLSPYFVRTWGAGRGGGTNRVKPHQVFIFKDLAKEPRSCWSWSLHLPAQRGMCSPHLSPHSAMTGRVLALVMCGLMRKDILRHLFNTPPFSLSGFLFFAIKQKQKDTSILGDDTRQYISALCKMNE